MLINKQALLEFQNLYYKEHLIRITESEANDYGNRLIYLVKAVYGNQLPDLKAIDNNIRKEQD